MGACAPDAVARADADKLRQILVNLLSNAVKFTEADGGRRGRVELSCRADGARVFVRVRDTGIGIAAEKLAAIFDPFVQVRADLTRTAEGTGLGLAISRRLARPMGGDLTVRSEVGVLPVAPRGRTRAGNCPDGASRPGRRPATELNATA
jgi:signal transduction histidine kinase